MLKVKRIEMLITSGAIHGYVPTSDIFVVLARNFEVPKSQIYNIQYIKNKVSKNIFGNLSNNLLERFKGIFSQN